MNVFLAVVHVYVRKNITHMMHSGSKMKNITVVDENYFLEATIGALETQQGIGT
jgi:hypothetical protein